MATITIILTKEQKTKVQAQPVQISSLITNQTIQTFMLSLLLMPQSCSMDLSILSTIMIRESLLITAWMSLVPGVITCLEASMGTLAAGTLLGYCSLRIKLMVNVSMSPITLNTSLTGIRADSTSTQRETFIHSTGQRNMLTFSSKGKLQLCSNSTTHLQSQGGRRYPLERLPFYTQYQRI